MKLKELKHNHSLTDLLKVLIFSILMITPLLSVATRCLYVICNKNAYQSAEITQTTYNRTPKYTQGDINNGLEEGKIYHLIATNLYTYQFFNTIGDDSGLYFNIINGGFLNFNYERAVVDELSLYEDPNDIVYSLYEQSLAIGVQNSNLYSNIIIDEPLISINADIYIIGGDFIENLKLTLFSNTTYQDYDYNEVESTTLDNVFEYSVNKLAESPILSWTQQTAIYTGVSTMTTQLGVNTPTIPMLIVYWFLLTVIYIIIDIIIKLFTWLTHMIGSKAV